MGEDHKRRRHCRACGQPLGEALVSLGPMPLANELLVPGEGEPGRGASFPLDVALCPRCGLAQLLDDIRPGRLFQAYPYLTGASDTMVAHFGAYAAQVTEALRGAPLRILEIGSNDGALLGALASHGATCLGVEPGSGPGEVARSRGVEVLEAFFGEPETQAALEARGPFDGIIANNVLAHVDEPGVVLEAACALLGPRGRVIVEFPDALRLLDGGHWDTIYHEHRAYLSLGALRPMAQKAGLQILRVEAQGVHGGSLRVWMGRLSEEAIPDSSVAQQLRCEEAGAVDAPARWRALGQLAERQSEALRTFLRAHGGEVYGYGAPAKATVRLNHAGVGPEHLPFIVDRNPWKVGRWVPGVDIPIHSVEDLIGAKPKGVIVFPWNIFEEIQGQLQGMLPPDCRTLPVTFLGDTPYE